MPSAYFLAPPTGHFYLDSTLNFLFHQRLALRDLADPAAGIGAMLPDLWRLADRRVRAQPDVLTDGPDAALFAGVAHHLEADRWFHASALFTAGLDHALELLREPGLAGARMGLLGHVAWELCLDGALVRRDGLAATVERVRRGFAAAPAEALERAAAVHHFDRVAREQHERARFTERMRDITVQLTAPAGTSWLGSYTIGHGLADVLGRIRARLGLAALADEQTRRLARVLDRLLAAADRRLAADPDLG